jgi:hypothetical protein
MVQSQGSGEVLLFSGVWMKDYLAEDFDLFGA